MKGPRNNDSPEATHILLMKILSSKYHSMLNGIHFSLEKWQISGKGQEKHKISLERIRQKSEESVPKNERDI